MALPSTYTRLNYIGTTGTQYIDTGFKPNQNTKFIVDIQLTNTLCHPFGARTAFTNKAFMLYWSSDSNYCVQMANSTFNGGTFDTTARTTVEMTASSLIMNGITQATYSVDAFQCEQNAWLMSCYGSGEAEYAKGKLYSAKIYDGSTLIRDFIPCQNASGTVGMWDNVNSVFYANAGTGVFTGVAEGELDLDPVGKHNTPIGSVACEITGGRCLVNGAGYKIKKGRTLVAGIGYDIKFTEEFTVTISTASPYSSTYAYCTVNGVRYTSAANLVVEEGTEIIAYVKSKSTSFQSLITLNGSFVYNKKSTSWGSYTLQVKANTNITLTCNNDSSGANGGHIRITES